VLEEVGEHVGGEGVVVQTVEFSAQRAEVDAHRHEGGDGIMDGQEQDAADEQERDMGYMDHELAAGQGKGGEGGKGGRGRGEGEEGGH
jgi:hypothetical protein